MPKVIRRHGAYVTSASASLALCVSATLTVFTIVNALWLRPLPFPDADRIVTIVADAGDTDVAYGTFERRPDGWPMFEAIAGQGTTSGAFASFKPRVQLDAVGRETETVGVTARYFGVLRLSVRGRDFSPADDRVGAEPVVIISDRLWAREFSRRPDIIGAVMPAGPFPIRVVGIAPPDFNGARRGEQVDLWVPRNLVTRLSTGTGGIGENELPVIPYGRLRPGVTATDAQKQLMDADRSDAMRRFWERTHVVPVNAVSGTTDSRSIVLRERGAASVVAALAVLVLLARCITLMTLVLVHYERRRRELSVRAALGAGRRTLVRLLTAELACVAVIGLSGALVMSHWSVRSLPSLSLPGGVDLSRLDLSIDARVLLACVLMTALTLGIAALLPLHRFTRAEIAGDLIAPAGTVSPSSHRLRQSLLAVHVASTIVVLVAAGLFVRVVVDGFRSGAGFDVDRTLFAEVMVVPPFVSAGDDMKRRDALVAERTGRLRERLESLAGVERVATGWAIGPAPASSMLASKKVEIDGPYATCEWARTS